ncbi:DUF2637 domain-containing protein [Gryllotalpicola protaetiae]|uniref:DUF2637 domain-containing protein n=1 Tax=Gryllotalpicola protaetiae TaxID=2419771 RepID=UPI0015E8AA71|nr:DUF2637 domain-containing protein [Gryllotalpicola protaetiae]
MTPATRTRGGRVAVATAVAGTVFIAAGAFWLSFTALADLARRSGVDAGQAWAWPLIVDGIIVVATVAVVALAGQRSAWYPWALLAAGAVVSVTANAIHAVVAADADVPGVLAASVAAVPPLVLLAITHLTVILTRPIPAPVPEASREPGEETATVAQPPVPVGREVAVLLREEEGWSNKQIARHLGVHPSTVGRWFARSALTDPDTEETT